MTKTTQTYDFANMTTEQALEILVDFDGPGPNPPVEVFTRSSTMSDMISVTR